MPEKRALSPLFTWRSAIADSDLPATAKHVALTLSLHMSERGESAFPSLETLAKETTRHKETVSQALRDLEGAGYLRIERGGGRGHPNRYSAVVPSVAERAESPDRSPKGSDETDTKGRIEPEKGSAHPTGGRTEDVSESVGSRPARPRDELFEAIIEYAGWDLDALTDAARGQANRAVAQLRKTKATPELVRAFPAWWRRKYPNADQPSPEVMLRHWPAFIASTKVSARKRVEVEAPGPAPEQPTPEEIEAADRAADEALARWRENHGQRPVEGEAVSPPKPAEEAEEQEPFPCPRGCGIMITNWREAMTHRCEDYIADEPKGELDEQTELVRALQASDTGWTSIGWNEISQVNEAYGKEITNRALRRLAGTKAPDFDADHNAIETFYVVAAELAALAEAQA